MYYDRKRRILILVFIVAFIILTVRGLSEVHLKNLVAGIKAELDKQELNDTQTGSYEIGNKRNDVCIQTWNANNNFVDIVEGDSYYIIGNVPHIYQKDKYPTACEAVAAVELMQYYNMDITVDDFIDYYLPQASEPYYYGGILKAESPWEYFIGNPRSPYGFGCYSTVIEGAMNRFCAGAYEIKTSYDKSLEELVDNYVVNGIPVMIWATMNMQEPHEGDSWELPSGDIFTFIRPEHALLLIGYDKENFYFSDSLDERQVVAYSKDCTQTAFEGMGSQSIVILPSDN